MSQVTLEDLGIETEDAPNPREGSHEATLGTVEQYTSKNGFHMIKLTFPGLSDQDGKKFDHKEFVQVPSPDAEDWAFDKLTRNLRFLGVPIPRGRKIAASSVGFDAVYGWLKPFEGNEYPITIVSDDNGYAKVKELK